jgi:hypothetical protein
LPREFSFRLFVIAGLAGGNDWDQLAEAMKQASYYFAIRESA